MGDLPSLPGLLSEPCIKPIRQPPSSKSGDGGAVTPGDVGDGSGMRRPGAGQPQCPLTADSSGATPVPRCNAAVPRPHRSEHIPSLYKNDVSRCKSRLHRPASSRPLCRRRASVERRGRNPPPIKGAKEVVGQPHRKAQTPNAGVTRSPLHIRHGPGEHGRSCPPGAGRSVPMRARRPRSQASASLVADSLDTGRGEVQRDLATVRGFVHPLPLGFQADRLDAGPRHQRGGRAGVHEGQAVPAS